jgi:hypothetical protein
MNREQVLLKRVKSLTWLFIVGLLLSGATALPLPWELDTMVKGLGLAGQTSDQVSSHLPHWLLLVREALHDADARYPFLFYGTDWLAFGHFVIAIAFVGALRDPVRSKWLFDFGMIACILVIPFALVFGGLRGIPLWWRMIDCSFGIFGIVPILLCRKWTAELERLQVT